MADSVAKVFLKHGAQILRAIGATKYCIVTGSRGTNWFEGSPASVMDALRRAQETLTEDDIVERTARALSDRLEGVAELWMGQAGACDRLSGLLGIVIPKKETSENAAARRETSAKVSALVLANAFIFEEQLAATDKRIKPLAKLENDKKLVQATSA